MVLHGCPVGSLFFLRFFDDMWRDFYVFEVFKFWFYSRLEHMDRLLGNSWTHLNFCPIKMAILGIEKHRDFRGSKSRFWGLVLDPKWSCATECAQVIVCDRVCPTYRVRPCVPNLSVSPMWSPSAPNASATSSRSSMMRGTPAIPPPHGSRIRSCYLSR